MHCGKRELAVCLKHFFLLGGSQIWGLLKIVNFSGRQKENVSNKENSRKHDNQDSYSFVDKTGPTVITDVERNAKWNMEGSS